jgi:hypothetical protein
MRASRSSDAMKANEVRKTRRSRGNLDVLHHDALHVLELRVDHCELITRGVPVKAEEIEALMRG